MPRSPVLHDVFSRRTFLRACGAVGAGLVSAPMVFGDPKRLAPAGGLNYTFVNQTNGKFADEHCFWSLNGGREWHSFTKQPTVPCPKRERARLFVGAPPKNFDDRAAFWDFIEYAYGGDVWNGNTTQVDGFCIPLTIELGVKKLGITESRGKLFDAFRKECPPEFKSCVKGDYWILSPCRAGFGAEGPYHRFFDKYVDEVWDFYADEKKTTSGKWTGRVVNGALTFTPVSLGKAHFGKSISCPKKPSTQDIFLGTGVLSGNAQFCAAINRHVLADPADWLDAAKFYQAQPCNWYSKFLHEHTIDHKCYGFCYDDVNEQAAFFSGKGDNLIVTMHWD